MPPDASTNSVEHSIRGIGQNAQRVVKIDRERRLWQSLEGQAHVRFAVLDSDKDGKMTLAEFNVSGDRMFKKLETNGDGVIGADDRSGSY